MGETVKVVAADGFSETADDEAAAALAAEALQVSGGADVAIVFVGQPTYAESEGYDRSSLELPQAQLDLIEQLAATGITVVTVVSGGGIVELGTVAEHSRGVLNAWLLGQAGAAAIADVLLGEVNPSGRLAETIPHRLQDNPSYLTFPGRDSVAVYGEGRYVGYRYYDALGLDVAYPFGYGLSYTTFDYSDLSITSIDETSWSVSFTITNTGERHGGEVPQLYVQGTPRTDEVPVHELRHFDKVWLAAGESQQVVFTVTLDDLARWDVADHRWTTVSGEYTIEVGTSSRDIRLIGTIHTDGDGWIPSLNEWNTIAEWANHPLGEELMKQFRKGVPADMTERAPELINMFLQQPLVKIATRPIGPSGDEMAEIVADLEARRQELMTQAKKD